MIWERDDPHAPRILRPETADSLALFVNLPGVRRGLRHLDDERQRQAWEWRQA